VWPQLLDDLIAQKPMTVGKGEQRNELLRPTRRPIALGDLALAYDDPEASEHLDANIADTRLHDVPSSRSRPRAAATRPRWRARPDIKEHKAVKPRPCVNRARPRMSGARCCAAEQGFFGVRRLRFPLQEVTLRARRGGRDVKLAVRADGEGLVSHAGAALIAETADRLGLAGALDHALVPLRERTSRHSPAAMVRDLR
jgi:hypothetical protein